MLNKFLRETNTKMAETTNEPPTTKIRIGTISVAGWKHESENGDWESYKIQRSYKDSDDKWQNTSSFRRDDIPKIILALQTAYRESFQKTESDSEEKKKA